MHAFVQRSAKNQTPANVYNRTWQPQPAPRTPAHWLQLQRTIGNQAVNSHVGRQCIEPNSYSRSARQPGCTGDYDRDKGSGR